MSFGLGLLVIEPATLVELPTATTRTSKSSIYSPDLQPFPALKPEMIPATSKIMIEYTPKFAIGGWTGASEMEFKCRKRTRRKEPVQIMMKNALPPQPHRHLLCIWVHSAALWQGCLVAIRSTKQGWVGTSADPLACFHSFRHDVMLSVELLVRGRSRGKGDSGARCGAKKTVICYPNSMTWENLWPTRCTARK
jgi:hypothetical protein